MKTTILKHLFILLLFATASISTAEAQTHNDNARRRQRYQTVENQQNTTDSTKHVGATIATPKASKSKVVDEQIIEESATAIDGASLRNSRQNTPQQLDSALALLKSSSTIEAYDKYFNDYLATTKRISNELNTSNVPRAHHLPEHDVPAHLGSFRHTYWVVV